jgi:DNA-directed RNA polymerase alpha subunit
VSGEEMKSDLPRGVGRPARRALAEAGYTRLEQLTEVREADILELHGVGPKAVGEIRRALAEKGMLFVDGRKSEVG